jgi:TolA-binding protein
MSKRASRGWCLAALVAFAAGCSNSIESGIESANDLLYKQQYVAAERLFHKLLKRLGEQGNLSEKEDQQRLAILDRLGKINALYLHDYAQGVTFYEKLVQLYPKSDQAFAARATVADIYQHKLGKLEAAIGEYQKLTAEFPERPETRWAQLQISSAFFQLKNYEQARTEAETLITRWADSPEAAQARFQIANSFYVEGRYTDAIATYEHLLEGEPDPSLASLVMFELGNCFQELGDSDRALAYYYACLSDHPNPMLVQRKIRHLRQRLHRTRPADAIMQLPEYVERRLATAGRGLEELDQPRPGAKRPTAAAQAPESGVFSGSTFDDNEGEVRADSPKEPSPPATPPPPEPAGP